MKSLEEIVLSYDRLAERLKNKPEDKKNVLKMLKEIQAGHSPFIMKYIMKFGDMLFTKFYEQVNFEVPEGLDLKQLVKDNSVIVIPNHQSHVDYLALNYILRRDYDIFVHIAAGINLNFFPMGKIFRDSGAFFIRRSFKSDVLYKMTLEAYLYSLLVKDKPIEFFFEGGRSRTGKLLPPRYGLLQMIIETYAKMINKEHKKQSLVFLPVSIVSERLPEEKAHARESMGAKKDPERTGQLLKLLKLTTQNFGTIHVKINEPIYFKEEREEVENNLKDLSHQYAFKCYRSIGKNMMVTPTSMLALVLLDEPHGALTWQDIIKTAKSITEFCTKFSIPLSPSLAEETFEESMLRGMSLLMAVQKVKLVEKKGLDEVYYAVDSSNRLPLLFLKNSILHHFLAPYFINSAIINLASKRKGTIDIERFFNSERDQLKFEFYLPTEKDLYSSALKIISYCLDKKIHSLDECLQFSDREIDIIAKKLSPFSSSFSYIFEAYYISARAVRHLVGEEFTKDKHKKVSKEVFEIESEHGHLIKYIESYSISLMKSSLEFFENQKILTRENGTFKVIDPAKLDKTIDRLAKELTELLSFNIKNA